VTNSLTCPECGSSWQEGQICQDDFHQMLFWEAEQPDLGAVHHLMVLCFHLQHPSLYAPEGLRAARILLDDFVERGLSTAEVRRRYQAQVRSDRRTWKIKGQSGAVGSYPEPVRWTMMARDVTEAGKESYLESVSRWARSVQEDLRGISV
jgi:hypothetical protein